MERNLREIIYDEPYKFEFFQAVRLFERIFPNKKPVGGKAMPVEENLRFRSYVTNNFPPSEIQEIRIVENEDDDTRIVEMLVNFMGMVGASGVLPAHYTDLVQDRIRHRDTAMWAFLDIFTHRTVSLFYRAWSKYRFPVAYERGNDDFTQFLYDFIGLGTRGMRGRMSLPDESLLPYCGLIAQKPHSVNAVENILSDYFSCRAKILQFFGQWLELDESDITKLGVEHSILGTSAMIGTRIWDQQSKMRFKLGPLTFKQFTAFLPTGNANGALRSIIRFLIGDEFDFDSQFVLMARQVPSTILTTRALRKPQLGWTSFLKTRPVLKDDEQLVLQ